MIYDRWGAGGVEMENWVKCNEGSLTELAELIPSSNGIRGRVAVVKFNLTAPLGGLGGGGS